MVAGLDVADHIRSTIRDQRDLGIMPLSSLLPFHSIYNLTQEVVPTFRVGFPTTTKHYKISPYEHPNRSP